MGRQPKSLERLEQDHGNTGVSKARLRELRENSVKIGEKVFEPPYTVVRNDNALEKWWDVIDLYQQSNVDLVSSADVGLLERYCLTYDEYMGLIEVRYSIENATLEPIARMDMLQKYKLEDQTNKKNTLLLRMEEQLFLTPLSKMRSLPRKAKKTDSELDLENKGFNV